MPRKPRFYLPNLPVHIVQRGNNRQTVFFAPDDYLTYLRLLEEGAQECYCAIHAYALMPNHIHLLVTPTIDKGVSRMMQYVGRKYVAYVNQRYNRTGTLWEGRHKGCVISAKEYLLPCSRYVELNPVRLGIVDQVEDYRWSSYRFNALGEHNPVLSPHMLYKQLGDTKLERLAEYKKLFLNDLSHEQLIKLRKATQTGTPLGGNTFKRHIENVLNCKVGYIDRGRPLKTALVGL